MLHAGLGWPRERGAVGEPQRASVGLHYGLDLIGLADEVGDEEIGGTVVYLLRLSDLADAPGAHHADEVGHRKRLLLIVRDEDEGDAELALERQKLDLHGRPQLLVEGGKRLIEKQDGRPIDDGPCKRHALLLSARHFVNAAPLEAAQPHHIEGLVDAPGDLLRRYPRPHLPETIGNVLLDVEMRKQRVVLEDHVDGTSIGRRSRHLAPGDEHLAAGRLFEAADHAQTRRLAAAGRAE